jgi:hypothetical protein
VSRDVRSCSGFSDACRVRDEATCWSGRRPRSLSIFGLGPQHRRMRPVAIDPSGLSRNRCSVVTMVPKADIQPRTRAKPCSANSRSFHWLPKA